MIDPTELAAMAQRLGKMARHLGSRQAAEQGRCDPVGLAEIAERLGVKPQTAQMWRHRKLLPEPSWTVSGQAAWDWATIERWARETGRL